MQKGKKLGNVTESLNKALDKLLQSFSANTQWTDINNWLQSLESVLRDNPSPFINEKVLLSKRLNQCINPILPSKLHQQVLKIHEVMFFNMRACADNDINQYIKLFSEDLGIFSLSILPYFAHANVSQHRLIIIQMLNNYFLDLGYQLVPMLMGIIKALLPAYNETTDTILKAAIQQFIQNLIKKAGRHYVISSIWSCILKFTDCRCAGAKFLSQLIPKMDYRKDQEQFESEHGFSREEEQLRRELELQEMGIANDKQKNADGKPIQVQGGGDIVFGKRTKSVHSNQQKIANQFEILEQKSLMSSQSFSKMDLPQYIVKKQGEHKIFADHKLKRRNTFDPFSNLVFNTGGKETMSPDRAPAKQLNDSDIVNDPMKSSQCPAITLGKKAEQSGHEIKLNKVPIMLSQGIEEIKQMASSNTNANNYPNHNTLVVSALISCLEDPSQFIKRAILDFMFTHLRLKSNVLDEGDKKVLVQAMIRLFRKKQVSVLKRVNRWLIGKEGQSGEYVISEKNQFILPLITNAFTNILSKQPINEETCINPIKIVQNFYMQHENLVTLTISQISIDILRYIFNYSYGFQFSQQALKAGNRFFSNIPSHYPQIFKSLCHKMMEGIQNKNDHLVFETVRYIDFCYTKLMKHEHNVEELEYITLTLSLLSSGLKLMAKNIAKGESFYKIYLRDLNLLIFNLVSRRESVQRFMQRQKNEADKKYLAQSGNQELPKQRLNYQKQISERQQKQRQTFQQILDNMEVFYIDLGHIIKSTVNVQIYEEIYKLSSMSMVKILNHLPLDYDAKDLPVWFAAIENGIRVSSPSISLAAIDSLIKCLLQEQQHPIYAQFKNAIVGDKGKKIGNDYQNLALQKLWALLDYPHMHSKIIDLIVAFSKFFPYQFTETVKKSFQTHSDPQKQASIQRFSHFWRLTGFKYKDLVLSNRQFAQLNKVGLFKMLDFLDDDNPLVRHAAKNWMIESLPLFHRVIEPLFLQLMKSGGDWYTTMRGLIVIKQTYDTKNIFNTFRRLRSLLQSGTYSFLRYVYQQPISDNLQQLRQRVTPIKESILCDANLKQSIVSEVSMGKQPVLSRALQKAEAMQTQVKRLTYIDMLIILSVKYIQGHALESMGIDFYTGNAGVNTSSIELLQSLMNYIDNPTICYKFINFIIEPLCKVLNQAVINQEFITQIQLLNLFKTIFFSSSFRKKAKAEEVREFFKKIFTQTIFLQSMLNGLKTPFSYVRTQFINFITSCIQLIANFLQPDQCTQCIKHILLTYYKIIKEIKVSLIEEVLIQEENKNQKLNQIEMRVSKNKEINAHILLSKILKIQIKAKKEEKIVRVSNNLQQVAKTNQILSILHGLSAILNYFYDLDKMSIKDLKFSFSNPYTIFDSFKSIVTLGFASSQKSGRLIAQTKFLHNLQTCEQILKDLSPVYETILRAWPLSEQFVRIATEQFTSIGSRSFNFQKFSKYNRVLKDLIDFVSREKESIWGKIFSIMQPMFYRFPREIMQIYLQLWVRDCTNVGQGKGKIQNSSDPLYIELNISNTQFLMKNVETIVVSNFPINIIVHAFLESDLVQQVKNHHEKMRKENKQSSLNLHISQIQAKLIYFLNIYFTYAFIDQKSLTKQSLLDIWSSILKAIRPFTESKSPTTAIWILDFINMCAVKYSPKQILGNEKFKTDLHGIVNERLKFIAQICSKKQTVFYDDPTKSNMNQNAKEDDGRYRLILPLPPTLFQIFKARFKQRKQSDKNLFPALKTGDYIQIQKINRLWCFKWLRKLGFEILQNTYLAEKMHFAVIRACQWMEIILPTIEDKAVQNIPYAESASQVLYSLLEQARLLFIKPLRASIFRIFDKDDFFICNKQTLQYWAQIIDWIVSYEKNNETFSQYLSKVSLSNSYFTSESVQNKNRVKSFSRICFILYSGSQDKYVFKLKGLLQKIADVIKKAEAAHPALLILILFSIRILILRLSEISLNQLFIDIWPMILAFLMQIFSRKLVKVQIANQISKNPNLLLAALKLIQMISISNLGQFAHHQWIFVYDYFGIKLSLMEPTTELSSILSERPQLSALASFTRSQNNSPFLYKPYMNNYISQHSVNYLPQKTDETIEHKPVCRKIIVKQSFVQNQDELKAYAYLLAQYLVKLNQFRIHVDQKQVEEVIINDFIKLDSFIHKI